MINNSEDIQKQTDQRICFSGGEGGEKAGGCGDAQRRAAGADGGASMAE